jgi:hypothetical protein
VGPLLDAAPSFGGALLHVLTNLLHVVAALYGQLARLLRNQLIERLLQFQRRLISLMHEI